MKWALLLLLAVSSRAADLRPASTGSSSSGSSTAAIAVATGTPTQFGNPAGTYVSSPTAVINFDSNIFTGTLESASTAFISLSPQISSNVVFSTNFGLAYGTSGSSVPPSGMLFFISSNSIAGSTFTAGASLTAFSTYTITANTLTLGRSILVECAFQNSGSALTGANQTISLNAVVGNELAANGGTASQWVRDRLTLTNTSANAVEPFGEALSNIGDQSGGSINAAFTGNLTNISWPFLTASANAVYCRAAVTSGGTIGFLWMKVSIQ